MTIAELINNLKGKEGETVRVTFSQLWNGDYGPQEGKYDIYINDIYIGFINLNK